MIGIVGIIAYLTVLSLSLVITRIATIALMHTGLSQQAARFQARSAYTGTGFTTGEAENVVNHPVRRRIVMLLMVARSAGMVTIIISLILSLGSENQSGILARLTWLVGGSILLLVLSHIRQVDRAMRVLIEKGLQRWTDLDVQDYASILDISGEYRITEMRVKEGEWLSGRQLKECELPAEGVLVIGIHRSNGDYVGVPQKDTTIDAGDRLVLYGRAATLKGLHGRRKDSEGEQAHARAVDEQRRVEANQNDQEVRYRERAQRKKKIQPVNR